MKLTIVYDNETLRDELKNDWGFSCYIETSNNHEKGNKIPKTTKTILLAERMVITKEQAKEHPYRNVLTRSVGQEEEVEPDFSKIKLHKNDRFLLCTDGIHSVLEEVSLYEILKYNETQIVCHKLIERTKSNGSKDNLTCIVIQVVKKDSWLKRLKILESTTAQISHEIISVFYLGLSIKR